MQKQEDIRNCYNNTAKAYADKFIDELGNKHFDRIALEAFADENKGRGKLIDLCCGPGQTTGYLYDCRLAHLTVTDISPAMISVTKRINPQLTFETAAMSALQYPDNFFGSAVAFYSIVHFSYGQVSAAFKEIQRVLVPGGQLLFSFHAGDHLVHLDHFLNHPVSIDFYFFEVTKIMSLLAETGFEVMDAVERQPYPNGEYAGKRAYSWVKKI